MGLFDFLSMADNYESRKVARFEGENGLVVDTVAVIDSDQPYETAVMHPDYNGGKLVIVEMYDTATDAQFGHDRWVARMTADPLPESLRDVSSAEVAALCDTFKVWRDYPRNKKEKL